MRIDLAADRAMMSVVDDHPRSAPWRRLVREVLQLSGSNSELLHHTEKSWASVTFSGARHTVGISFTGYEAMDAANDFIAALPEHEFTIPGWLAADATITSVDQRTLPEPKVTVEAEVLLLEDR